jgi:hypothetical protein
MAAYFFAATESAHDQLTYLYDFVWPTTVAMWNLRWQVQGFMSVRPDATDKMLVGRFSEGAEVHGANLKRACVEHSWNDQKESFARVLLYNCFAIFEGWVTQILDDIGSHSKANEKGLQFPTAIPPNLSILDVLANLTATESQVLKGAFYGPLTQQPKYGLRHLANLLRCYRYFKEIRNSLMHMGGAASQRTLDAYADYVAITNPADLGMSELSEHRPVVLGARPELSLRGVVGLSDVMLRILTTVDAELCRSQKSEAAFERKWKQKYPRRVQDLPSDVAKRGARIGKLTVLAGFPKPERPAKLADFLKTKNLAWF